MGTVRTQVGIIGAGPAGLVLSHLLHLQGIESVVLESHAREYIEKRVRAGVLEQGTVDLLVASGVGGRLLRESLVHRGLEIRFDRRGHRIALADLTGGRTITVYGQQEVVKDLVAARLAAGGQVLFDAPAVEVQQLLSDRPTIIYEQRGERHVLECDVVAGCDGFHGVSRNALPPGALTIYERDYPFVWLGILAATPPSSEELIYAHSEHGFALHSMRSPSISRLYLQISRDDDLSQWPDERVWEELQLRLGNDDGWVLHPGPVLEKGATDLRSFVAEPMRFGRLFLAGDAAHIVPPTGAKGMNLAISDARLLASALAEWYRSGSEELLDAYSPACLRRVWRAEHFASWMTTLLHLHPDDDAFGRGLQRSHLAYVCSSQAAQMSLAENYVGLGAV